MSALTSDSTSPISLVAVYLGGNPSGADPRPFAGQKQDRMDNSAEQLADRARGYLLMVLPDDDWLGAALYGAGHIRRSTVPNDAGWQFHLPPHAVGHGAGRGG